MLSNFTPPAGRVKQTRHTRCYRPDNDGFRRHSSPCLSPPDTLSDWLFNQDSLTRRLVAASAGDFQVQVLSQGFVRPRLSEQQMLGLPAREVALVREVILWGCGQPWVFARSIVPLTTLSGRYRFLRHLGSQPLGELLFNDPTMRRGKFELMQSNISELNTTELNIAKLSLAPTATCALAPETNIWGRRSVFYLSDKPLLVGEFFLPNFTS